MSAAKRLWSYQDIRRRFLIPAETKLAKGWEEDAPRIAQELWCKATAISRKQLLLGDVQEPSVEQLKLFEGFVERLLTGEPLAYVEGLAYFYGLEFTVDSRVLVPRADSECLVDWAIELLRGQGEQHILDMGTGSGCLLLSVLQNLPLCSGLAIDQSQSALEIATLNANRLGLIDRVVFQQSNWWSDVPKTQKFDLIIANPPYIEPAEETGFGVREFEPCQALFTSSGNPLEAYKDILDQAAGHLKPGGGVMFEVGINRADQIAALCREHGFSSCSRRSDLGGIERVLYACLPASS